MMRRFLAAAQAVVYVTLFVAFAVMILFYKPLSPDMRVCFSLQKNGSVRSVACPNKAVSDLSREANRTAITKAETDVQDTPTKNVPLVDVALKKRLHTLGLQRGDRLFIRIFKSESLLEIWMEKEGVFRHVKDYKICAWSGRLGPKLKEGDRQSPEGFYRVYKHSLNPHSRFHLSFNLGFPNAYDRAHGRTGSYLMVHGACRSVGCYAMTNRNIDEIYALVKAALDAGQSYVPVHIFPFRLEDERLASYEGHRWFDFWMNLKEGYDWFEAERRPPKVKVRHGRYVFEEE